MTVWNLGSILLHLILGTHRLTTKEFMKKFQDKEFSFEAMGIKSARISKISS